MSSEMQIVVAADGSGDFMRVQAAIDAVPAQRSTPVTILIKPGIYKEKLVIEKPALRLIGEDADRTILTCDDYALKLGPDGKKLGTFNSYSILIGADDFAAEQLTFENSAGDGRLVGQAVAAYVDADRAAFSHCRFVGHQDTLFTGPLPPQPIIPGGFTGPREFAARRPGRHYYCHCYLEGDVDFIFGSATAVFDHCEICALDRSEAVNSYITAASTPEGQTVGYVFLNCRFTSTAAAHTVYLGRPWRNYARVALLDCWLGEHINPAGWHNWNKPDAEQTVLFAEYQSTGPGARPSERVPWARMLTPEEAERYTIAQILGGTDGWQPEEILSSGK